LNEATATLNALSAENKRLSDASAAALRELEQFTNSDSYAMLQRARRSQMMQEDWKENRAPLMADVESAENELRGYLDGNETLFRLAMVIAEQENEYAKTLEAFETKRSQIDGDLSVTERHRDKVMRSFQQELANVRSQQLALQRNLTQQEVRKSRVHIDRVIQKFKTESRLAFKAVERAVRLKERDSEHAELNRILGEFADNHRQSYDRTRTILDIWLEDTEAMIKRYEGVGSDGVDQEIVIVWNEHSKFVSLTQAQGTRVKQRTAERELELNDLASRIRLTEGIIQDYAKPCEDLAAEHRDLVEAFFEWEPEKVTELNCKMDRQIGQFIRKGNAILNVLMAMMESAIKVERLPLLKVLPRSKSCNNVAGFERSEEPPIKTGFLSAKRFPRKRRDIRSRRDDDDSDAPSRSHSQRVEEPGVERRGESARDRYPQDSMKLRHLAMSVRAFKKWDIYPPRESILFAVIPLGSADVEESIYVVGGHCNQLVLKPVENEVSRPTSKRKFVIREPDEEGDVQRAAYEYLPTTRAPTPTAVKVRATRQPPLSVPVRKKHPKTRFALAEQEMQRIIKMPMSARRSPKFL
jgi:hypothetical protein